MEPVRAASLPVWRDRERLRDLVMCAYDGIVAIAGVIEGVLDAGLGNRRPRRRCSWRRSPADVPLGRTVAVGLTPWLCRSRSGP
jgi:hypothetical protein